ncbi:MAG: hypothetical protein CL609_17540 [Anaerolineaceae bacterium]|nr:hypothetical protein [Anaerolineaceae bacterium]
MKKWLFSLILVLLAGCINQSMVEKPSNNILRLVTSEEPGTPLTINGVILDQITNKPIPGVEIYLYQADDGGNYSPADPADESTARLHGIVWTDHDGKFSLHTILPGEYDETQDGNRHIHIETIQAEGYQDKGGLILFDHNVNASVRTWALDSGFGYIIEVKENEQGVLHGQLEIKLEPKDT